ncbi:MAG: hypothetical protein JNL38_16735 [Myxococcales bacterium]|nr:hypothetical protein [Myxococcales bacterium]
MPAKPTPKNAKKAAPKNAAPKNTAPKKAAPKKAAPKKAAPKKAAPQKASSAPAKPAAGAGSRQKPWKLKTPPGTSEFLAFEDPQATPPALVVQVGKTELRYHLRCVDDLLAMLLAHGDWMPLGGADEQKPALEGSVEAWARSETNPVKGWYGLKKGLRGRFGVYVPPVLEALGLVELEHLPKNNRVRARE